MKEWKYLIGNADDFIGAPEWASIIYTYGNSDLIRFCNGWKEGCKFSGAKEFLTRQYDVSTIDLIRYKIIAQRTESFGNAIDLEFCKANPDHPDCKCKEGFLKGAFKQSEGEVIKAISEEMQRQINELSKDTGFSKDALLGKHEAYTIDIEEPKMADTNMGTLTYKVSLDLSEMDAEVSEAYYKKRAAYLAKKNKYVRICKGLPVDVYDVLQAFTVTNPATQHAIKKLLCAGLRGHKDKMQDLTEALKSIERAIELEKE